MARLIWKKTDSPDDDVIFELSEPEMIVGRDPQCAVFIDAPLLSRAHARIDHKDDGHVVVDLGSTNFTKVNGARVTSTLLKDGDEVHFSRARCVYQA